MHFEVYRSGRAAARHSKQYVGAEWPMLLMYCTVLYVTGRARSPAYVTYSSLQNSVK